MKLILLLISCCLCQNTTTTTVIPTSVVTTATTEVVVITTTTTISQDQPQNPPLTQPPPGQTQVQPPPQSITSTQTQPTTVAETSKDEGKLSTGVTVVIVIIGVCILAAGVGIYAFRVFGLKPSDHFKTRLRKQKTEDTITRLDPTDVIHSLSHSASPVGHGLNNDKRMDDARPGVKNDSRAGGRNVVDKDGIHLSYPRPFDGDGGYENNGYDDYGNSRNEYYAYDPNSIHYDPSQSHQGPSPKMFKIGPKDSGQ